jgi:hypothetical protein
LESRLRARLPLAGSTMWRLTWKRRVTPSGRRILALRVCGRHTSGSGSITWLTPTAVERWSKDWIVMTKNGTPRRRYKNGKTSSLGLTQQVRMLESTQAGSVNPAWLAWLMGFPAAWVSGLVTRSALKRRRSS